MSTPLNTIFSWFETGDFPTQNQFKETFLSFYHKDYLIPKENIEGFEEIFQSFELEIEKIKKKLLSDDLSLDELQEIVGFIKKSREDIEALKALPIGESREDKVKLLLDYDWLQNPKNQQEFNKQIYDKVLLISQTPTSAVVQITESTVFPNVLETENVIIQARDSVTGKKINIDDYATNQTIEINMLGDLPNPINILILKVKP
ncbi:hypothetical protein [Chryseobacterium indoltheticum]|uniref:hypothetical protein n=1 Tax=Chryseobacterium indoltheticum TaxID=254 RepID=UPI003F49A038